MRIFKAAISPFSFAILLGQLVSLGFHTHNLFLDFLVAGNGIGELQIFGLKAGDLCKKLFGGGSRRLGRYIG